MKFFAELARWMAFGWLIGVAIVLIFVPDPQYAAQQQCRQCDDITRRADKARADWERIRETKIKPEAN